MTPEEIFKKMQTLISDQFSIDEDEIALSTSFADDIRADSVDLVELVMAMEDEFELDEIEEDELAQLKTVGDCVKFLSGKLNQ